jgi:hypothetical protein
LRFLEHGDPAMNITTRLRRLARLGMAFLLGLTLVTTAATALSTATARPALAATSTNGRGPSAAADEFNNQYVVWRGATGSNNLWYAYYNAYTKTWNGPIDLGMGTLGSEPTIAVSDQVFAGPGGKEFNAQYVYWRGTDGYLYMAYWQGSWHGPVRINVPLCSQPSATALLAPTGLKIYVYWKGLGNTASACQASSGAELWYAFSLTANPTAASNYSGPNYDSYAGLVGSSPSVTSTGEECSVGGTTCDDLAIIAWQGQDGGLWSEQFNVLTGNVTGPTEDSYAGTLGSPPSVAGYFVNTSTQTFDIVWQGGGADHYLRIGHSENGSYLPVSDLTSSGGLGSAPTIADSQALGNVYVFGIGGGAQHDLWEAYWNASNGVWSVMNLGMGPLA